MLVSDWREPVWVLLDIDVIPAREQCLTAKAFEGLVEGAVDLSLLVQAVGQTLPTCQWRNVHL